MPNVQDYETALHAYIGANDFDEEDTMHRIGDWAEWFAQEERDTLFGPGLYAICEE